MVLLGYFVLPSFIPEPLAIRGFCPQAGVAHPLFRPHEQGEGRHFDDPRLNRGRRLGGRDSRGKKMQEYFDEGPVDQR
ncbi:MAG: hypothetical protein CVU64_18830 [Deltaproteobacteria bacterium HGW-Deltaproteobacteria-21]|nr:MAG: hypothetical protein CVU64_18830 [Deltaproteobacteria bacterium HGW-Deltaproteobacteria-21]